MEAKKLASFFLYDSVYLCAVVKDLVTIDEVMSHLRQWQFVDVRSPGEFKDGHIPGAINIPLFSDEERAIIGTLYKQVSPEAALKEGLKIAGSHMLSYLEAAKKINRDKEGIIIHCWRGGKRSEAMHWLFNFGGLPSRRLDGGYKSYRQAIQAYFSQHRFDLRILGGHTGSGKTEILRALHTRGEQVIDLEQLARHKGSAFGSIGEEEQPTNEQFENDLLEAFLKLDPTKPIWLENESRNIGRVYMPEPLWLQMREAVLYHVEVTPDVRLDRVISYYAQPADSETLKHSFEKIRKRLGGLDYQLAIKALDEGDLRTAGAIALKYYDKSYSFQLSHWSPDKVRMVEECSRVEIAADKLIDISLKASVLD